MASDEMKGTQDTDTAAERTLMDMLAGLQHSTDPVKTLEAVLPDVAVMRLIWVNVGEHVCPLPADGSVPGMAGWRWIDTHGHTPGHIALFREADRVLIIGDAFTTTDQESLLAVMSQKREIHGPPKYFTPDWQDAEETVKRLAALHPAIVIPSHGKVMRGEELEKGLADLAQHFQERAIPHGRRRAA